MKQLRGITHPYVVFTNVGTILSIYVWNRRLTEAIMFCHFGVKLRIPGNRLCPPVSLNQSTSSWTMLKGRI